MKRIAAVFCLGFSSLASAVTYEEAVRFKQEQKLEAAAAAFALVLQEQPENLKALEQLAVVQGWLQRYDDAIANWRKGQALAPQSATFYVGQARVLYWKQTYAAANEALDQALTLEPDNIEALSLKGDVLLADEDPRGARQAYEKAKARSGGSATPELDQKIVRAVSPSHWRLDSGVTFDDYDNFRKQEYSAFSQIGKQVTPALSVYGRFEHYDNFGTTDEGLIAGAYLLVKRRLLLNAELGATVDEAFFRPEALASLNAELLLDGPVQPLLGLRYLDYSNGEVSTITPGVRLRANAAELELRYGFTNNVDDSNTGVFSARAGYSAGLYVPYLSYAVGEEALPPQALADIRIYGAGCVFNPGPAWGLRLDYSYEDRKDIYKRKSLGLGLTYRF